MGQPLIRVLWCKHATELSSQVECLTYSKIILISMPKKCWNPLKKAIITLGKYALKGGLHVSERVRTSNY